MRETHLSNPERKFVLNCIQRNLRLDGRSLDGFRPLRISFGSALGSVNVSIGETRVLAQVSCELSEPKATRPNEGLLYINIELGPMAAVHLEAGRNSELTVQYNRILERIFKDSSCVDLESLCATAEEKAWTLRVDLNVLNNEGNIIDCASVAALCALAHFKYPDVGVTDEEIKIHAASEKDLIPVVLHHYPVCVSFATFHNGEKAVADPALIEERTAETNIIFGFNSYHELCCINLGGRTLTSSNLFLQCAVKAANQARIVVECVKEALILDTKARSAGKLFGFTECLRLGRITSLEQNRLRVKLPNFDFNTRIKQQETVKQGNMEQNTLVKVIGISTSILESAQKNIRWIPKSESSESDDLSDKDRYNDDGLRLKRVGKVLKNIDNAGKSTLKHPVNVTAEKDYVQKLEGILPDSEEKQ